MRGGLQGVLSAQSQCDFTHDLVYPQLPALVTAAAPLSPCPAALEA